MYILNVKNIVETIDRRHQVAYRIALLCTPEGMFLFLNFVYTLLCSYSCYSLIVAFCQDIIINIIVSILSIIYFFFGNISKINFSSTNLITKKSLILNFSFLQSRENFLNAMMDQKWQKLNASKFKKRNFFFLWTFIVMILIL